SSSSSSCGSLRKGCGNDGACKTLRVSHPPWKSLRDSHIATAPTTARLVQYKIKKGAFLSHTLRLPSGSFFNWKRLAVRLKNRVARDAFSAAQSRLTTLLDG